MDYEGIYPIETIKGKNHIRYFQMDFNLDLIGNSPAWDFPMGSYTANFEFQWDHDFLLNFQEDIFCWDNKTNASNRVFPCKFCSAAGHGMNKCPAYPDLESRLQRCDQLNICRFCSSAKHATEDCPGHQDNFLDYACAYCNLHTHISALCEKGHSKKNDGQTMSYLCINYSNGEQN